MPASVIRPGRVSADRELRQLGTIVPANAPAANCGSQQWQAILAQSRPQLERLTAIQDRQSRIVDACDVVFENGCSLRIIERGNRLGMADASGLSDDSAG
jgi:hypothetical protein